MFCSEVCTSHREGNSLNVEVSLPKYNVIIRVSMRKRKGRGAVLKGRTAAVVEPQPSAFPQLAPDHGRRTLFLGTVLVVATLLLYLPVVHHQFLTGWDDDLYVTSNLHVRSGFNLQSIAWAFSTLDPYYWHPLALLSHITDYAFFGLNAGAHHYVNVAIQAVDVLLLFLLLQRATGAIWRSFLVAGLFALHPINVETVAWVAERKSLLSAFFSLLTLAAYGWYVQRPDWKRYLAVVAGFSLALMAKPAAVTLPVMLLLVDYWPMDRFKELPFFQRLKRLSLEKAPLALMSLGISRLTFVGMQASGSVIGFADLPVLARIENALISYVSYIGDVLWPARLLPFYPHPAYRTTIPAEQVFVSALILVAITALVCYFHRARFALVGWLFFVATAFPAIGFVQAGIQGRQDHFIYIPSIGLFVLMVWGSAAAMEAGAIPYVVRVLVSLSVLAGCAAATAHYLTYWKDGVTLFGYTRTVYGRPNSWLELLYGNALREAGRSEEALQHYKQSCDLSPEDRCYFYSAEIEFDRHEFEQAEKDYVVALKLTHKKAIALTSCNKSAEALLSVGNSAAAERAVEMALAVDPEDATALQLQERISRARRQ